LVKGLLEKGGRVFRMGTALQERPTLSTSQLDARHILNWPRDMDEVLCVQKRRGVMVSHLTKA